MPAALRYTRMGPPTASRLRRPIRNTRKRPSWWRPLQMACWLLAITKTRENTDVCGACRNHRKPISLFVEGSAQEWRHLGGVRGPRSGVRDPVVRDPV